MARGRETSGALIRRSAAMSVRLSSSIKRLRACRLHRRIQARDAAKGDFEQPNPNSAAVWHYVGSDPKKFDATMHRSLSSAAIKDDLLFITDESGLVHCLDA